MKNSEIKKISRARIDLFIECPKCFYLQEVHKIKRPSGPAFTLNIAVDHLMKKEFDIARAKDKAHPLMKKYGLKLVPLAHDELNKWRENFHGIQFLHKTTNMLITGAVDDIWRDDKGILYVVDYKATSTEKEISLNDEWKEGYKRQMEVYQWLLRQNGFKVSNTGYFVFCNALKDKKAFDAKLEFDLKIIPYKGDDSWVQPIITSIGKLLKKKTAPKASKNCEYCSYREKISNLKT